MSYPHPVKGTVITIRELDEGVFIEFTCPTTNGENVHLFDITPMWREWVETVNTIGGKRRGGLGIYGPPHSAVIQELQEPEQETAQESPEFDRVVARFIEQGHLSLASVALKLFLESVMEGPEEDAMEGLRVYAALWQRVEDLKKEKVRSN